MYCTIDDMRKLLPPNVMIGDQNLGTPSPGRGANRSNFSPNDARKYISYAQQYIDAILRPYYACPLRRIKSYETEVTANIRSGSPSNILVSDSSVFAYDDLVRVQDRTNMELCTVTVVPNDTTVTAQTVQNDYSAANTIISIVEFPDPIPIIAARLAVAYAFDRLFVETQSPDVSNYGKTQRNLARGSMEDVLSGAVLLFGQEHTGRRFCRGSLFDAFKSPAEIQKGADKE